jgi:hypothetical protein
MLGVFAEFEANLRPERQAYQVVRHARDDQLHLPAVSAEREDACAAHVEGALHERHGTLVRGDRQGQSRKHLPAAVPVSIGCSVAFRSMRVTISKAAPLLGAGSPRTRPPSGRPLGMERYWSVVLTRAEGAEPRDLGRWRPGKRNEPAGNPRRPPAMIRRFRAVRQLPRNGHISAIAAPKRIKVQPLTGVTDPPS